MVIGQIDTQTAGNKYKYVTKSKLSINLFYVFLVLYLPWVIPAGCVTDIVFREPILILPPVETKHCISLHSNSRLDVLGKILLMHELGSTCYLCSVALLLSSGMVKFFCQWWVQYSSPGGGWPALKTYEFDETSQTL